MMGGIHLDHSNGLSIPSIKGGALGFAITTSSVHIEVRHGTFYASAVRSEV